MAAKASRPRWRKIVERVLIGLSLVVLVVGTGDATVTYFVADVVLGAAASAT